MKCETPAFASVSSREPAPIQNPSATERTPGTRSEITRSPESSSERTYFCTPALSRSQPKAGTSSPCASSSRSTSTAGSCGRRTELFDAERVRLGIPHDRPGTFGVALRLDDGRAEAAQPFDLLLAVVRADVEMDRVRRGPRLLPPLEQEARAARRRFPGSEDRPR